MAEAARQTVIIKSAAGNRDTRRIAIAGQRYPGRGLFSIAVRTEWYRNTCVFARLHIVAYDI